MKIDKRKDNPGRRNNSNVVTDKQIIEVLRENPKASLTELTELIGYTRQHTLQRIRDVRDRGVNININKINETYIEYIE